MEVFRLRYPNGYQRFLPSDQAVWETNLLEMDCRPKAAIWSPPELYIHNPRLQRGSFFHLCSGAFVVDARSTEILRPVLERAGELLPLPHDNELFYLVNVLECVNCLDERSTKWILGSTTKARIGIDEYQFHTNRFSESTLFKIPETATSEILVTAGIAGEEDDFKTMVEREMLTGITFERVWSDSLIRE